ncbi:ADP-ribosylglycohydrolase family protein [Streptomyces sp. NPDC058691]|uniref:ADP-ribosylglycohydrolase family protein n=1 Tax=Streptomyces sp. NPDC058691 TaxID=3346601 RepID=UPI003665A969
MTPSAAAGSGWRGVRGARGGDAAAVLEAGTGPWPWTDVPAQALARCAPLAAGPHSGRDAVADAAARQAAVSHHHPEATAGASPWPSPPHRPPAAATDPPSACCGRSATAPRPATYAPACASRAAFRRASPSGTPHVLGSGYGVSGPDTAPFGLWCAATHLDDLPGGVAAARTVVAGGLRTCPDLCVLDEFGEGT